MVLISSGKAGIKDTYMVTAQYVKATLHKKRQNAILVKFETSIVYFFPFLLWEICSLDFNFVLFVYVKSF